MNFPEHWGAAAESGAPQETSFLAEWQERAVRSLAPRLPANVSAADLTKISVMGAAIAAGALLGCRWGIWFVLLVPVGMAVNWLGAAVDAPLRDHRQQFGSKHKLTEHIADLVSQLLVIVAYGLSPFLSIESAAIVLACYLLFSAYSFIRVAAGREGPMALIGIGAAEFRILMAFWPFAALALGLVRPGAADFSPMDYAIVLLAAIAVVNLGLKVVFDGRRISSARG